MTEPTVIVRPDRERMFDNRHPWVFSGAIQQVNGNPANGDIVIVRTVSGAFLGRGYWNRQSQISVHMLCRDKEKPIDEDFWRSLLRRSVEGRAAENARYDHGTSIAYRL